MKLNRKKIILIVIVLIVLLGLASYYYYQRNIYSKEVLKLEILGPSETEVAQEIEYIIKYKNNGDILLEDPRLIFEYPSNSLIENGGPMRQEIFLEDIYPGQERTFTFKARLLGKEGETKVARAWLSYRPRNLQARFESDTSLTTVIERVPLTFDFDMPSRVESDKSFDFRMNYFSNIDYPLSDLRIQIEYPFSFEFIEASPRALERVEWEVPLLNPYQGGRINVSGKLSADIGETKVFRAKLGIWQDGDFILLKEAVKGIGIIKPSIYIRQEINDNPRYVAYPGDWLRYEIYFKNIGEETLTDLFMVTRLEGEAFDFETMRSDYGSVRPGDNSIVFDWREVSFLQYLSPMEEAKVDFWVKLKDDLGRVQEPSLKNIVSIGQVREEFVNKVSSRMELAQKGYFQDEIFGNSGPVPPRAGESTTYTITWQVKNYYSDVDDVKVTAVLPRGVDLTGRIFPEEESSKFAFDSSSREVTWSVGDLERGSGVTMPARNISFQVSFVPNLDQRGQTPEIISQAIVSGEDTWTEASLEFSAPALTTDLPDDDTVSEDQGIVQ